jgi:CRISPR-associated protein Cmr5
MNSKIESYINPAMEVLTDAATSSGGLKKEYKGYISSLGASLIMSGLIPTMAFYSSKENSAKAERWKVLEWVFNVLRKTNGYTSIPTNLTLFEFSRQTGTNKKKLEKDIRDVSIALKLCIRTFELTN